MFSIVISGHCCWTEGRVKPSSSGVTCARTRKESVRMRIPIVEKDFINSTYRIRSAAQLSLDLAEVVLVVLQGSPFAQGSPHGERTRMVCAYFAHRRWSGSGPNSRG